MKLLFLLFLFFGLLKLILPIIPLWNFEDSSIDLMPLGQNTYSYIISDREMYGMKVKLEKEITRSSSSISFKNKISIIIDEKEFEKDDVPWENIESFYNLKVNDKKYQLICPKGNFHVQLFTGSSFDDKIPEGFSYNDDWDLKCYYQPKVNYFFVTYSNNRNIHFYSWKLSTNEWQDYINIHNGIYDFKWMTEPIPNDSNDYSMKVIALNGDIYLIIIKFTLEENSIGKNDIGNKKITEANNKSYAYFNNYTDNFYFMTYNSTSFKSGYYNSNDTIYSDNISKVEVTLNNESPFQFIDDVIIKNIRFISNTQYAYYEISNNKTNKTYHGIIDIILNKVIFNTDEDIDTFIPYSNNSMLAITKKSAYKICAISDGNNNCIEKCTEGSLIISNFEPNYCGKCNNIIFKPNDICIDKCDESYYYKKDNQCGLCKDIGDGKEYKLINSTGCIETSCPNGAEELNTDLHLCTCKEGYLLNNNECVSDAPKCHNNCETCSEYSDNDSDQKCTSCNNTLNFVLEEGNCINKCSDNYFETNDKNCSRCDESCKTCYGNSNNCTSCEKGRFLDEKNECKNCSDNCETCSENSEKCDSCKGNSKNKYLIESNNTCVEICPKGTELDEGSYKCIIKETPDKKKPNYMLWIFIILIVITLIIISLIICKKVCNKKKERSNIEAQFDNELDGKELIN